MIFVDTNYFLRYLREDIPHQSEQAKKLFLKSAQGKKQLCTSLIVFFEIFWVMDRFYQYSKSEIIKSLRGIIAMDFLILPEKKIIRQAITIFENTTLEFEDCYNLVYAWENEATDFKTFDKKLQKHLKK